MERIFWILLPFILIIFPLTFLGGCCNKGVIQTEVATDLSLARTIKEVPQNEAPTNEPATEPQEFPQ